MLVQIHDGSILDASGKILFFSIDRFVTDICEGNCCFICGVSPSEAKFNDEHVLPEWILRKCNLFSKLVKLPNGTGLRYDQYTIPCCEGCNSLMGQVFESPFSDLVAQGHSAIAQFLTTDNGSRLIFVWLALIFIKTHLKDKSLRLHRDHRMQDQKIADLYTWEELHHIHCIARSFYTKCSLDPKVRGSLLVLPAQMENYYEHFDFSDLYASKTVLLRVGDVAFITVLNDSCAAWNFHQPLLKKLTGVLSPIQLRELMAHFAFVNLHLRAQPRFFSETDPYGTLRICVSLPDKVELEDYDPSQFGSVLHACCGEIISNLQDDCKKELMEDYVKQGKWSFLFNAEGYFIHNSMEPIPPLPERKT